MKKKILIIDDEELIIKSLRKLLESQGFDAFVAKNGRDALIMTEEEQFSLVIADIRMPGMNGVDTISEMYSKAEGKALGKVPVIFITGYADENIHNRAMKLKPLAYIYKPFDIQELVDKVKKAVK